MRLVAISWWVASLCLSACSDSTVPPSTGGQSGTDASDLERPTCVTADEGELVSPEELISDLGISAATIASRIAGRRELACVSPGCATTMLLDVVPLDEAMLAYGQWSDGTAGSCTLLTLAVDAESWTTDGNYDVTFSEITASSAQYLDMVGENRDAAAQATEQPVSAWINFEGTPTLTSVDGVISAIDSEDVYGVFAWMSTDGVMSGTDSNGVDFTGDDCDVESVGDTESAIAKCLTDGVCLGANPHPYCASTSDVASAELCAALPSVTVPVDRVDCGDGVLYRWLGGTSVVQCLYDATGQLIGTRSVTDMGEYCNFQSNSWSWGSAIRPTCRNRESGNNLCQ